jgi:hypothetical protein
MRHAIMLPPPPPLFATPSFRVLRHAADAYDAAAP